MKGHVDMKVEKPCRFHPLWVSFPHVTYVGYMAHNQWLMVYLFIPSLEYKGLMQAAFLIVKKVNRNLKIKHHEVPSYGPSR